MCGNHRTTYNVAMVVVSIYSWTHACSKATRMFQYRMRIHEPKPEWLIFFRETDLVDWIATAYKIWIRLATFWHGLSRVPQSELFEHSIFLPLQGLTCTCYMNIYTSIDKLMKNYDIWSRKLDLNNKYLVRKRVHFNFFVLIIYSFLHNAWKQNWIRIAFKYLQYE